MPMGDCDKFKTYISDYLENDLDPSSRKEFEKALKSSGDLQDLTSGIKILTRNLRNLNTPKCSDDFSVKLRERIHSSSEPSVTRAPFIRYSVAASFVVVIAIATFSLMSLFNTPEIRSTSPESITVQPKVTAGPISSGVKTSANAFAKEEELNLKTKSETGMADSSRIFGTEHKKDNPNFKVVDQKKK